jgi:hypothetical protein
MTAAAPTAPPSTPPSTRTLVLLPVGLLFGSFGVMTAVAVLLFALLFDPERQASSQGFHALGLALGSVTAGCVVGVTVLAVATWRVRHRLALRSPNAVGGMVLVLALLGLAAVALLHLAGYGILGGVIGTGQRRLDIAVRVAAATACLLIAPAGLGLALSRRFRLIGVVVIGTVLAGAVAAAAMVPLAAADERDDAIRGLPYVLPPDVTPEVVEGAEGFTVELSTLTAVPVYELLVPLGEAGETPEGIPIEEDVRSYTEFAIMLSAFPDCGQWRDEVSCERSGAAVVVELVNGPVVAVRPDPDGGAYGIMLAETENPASEEARTRRAQDLAADLRRVTQEEFEAALHVDVQ